MNCPKCEEIRLSKIQFKESKKIAYLCTNCHTFWLFQEHIDPTTGHLLNESEDDLHANQTFDYLYKEDKDREEVIDERERESYGLF